MAGLCAALAAARCGVQTVLMHDRPVLGGNASSECRVHITGACRNGSRPNARETGITEELQLRNLAVNPHRSPSLWDMVLWEAARSEPSLRVLFNCSCREAQIESNRLVSVTGWQTTTQKEITVEAHFFADCSGDSITGPIAGAEFRRGRESRDEFDEPLAPEHPDGQTMGMTCYFAGRETDRLQTFVRPGWAYDFKSIEDLSPGRRPHGPHFGYWWVELGGDRDSIADTEDVRDELLRIVFGLWDLIKNSGQYDAENWALDWVQFLPGKRESRRLVGDHLLCQRDIESGGRFHDTVAYGGWPMDQHPPAGFWSPEPPADFGKVQDLYGIPLRSLYSRNITNLWMAGRNASCTHVGMSSTRVMGTCSLMGQAAGTAAAYALRYGLQPRDCARGDAIRAIQQKLLAGDCYLPGYRREFRQDTVTASLTASRGNPEPLRNGVGRPAGSEANSWTGKPGDRVEYRWSEPCVLNNVVLAFDSDLSIPISLSYASHHREETPPELVKHFRLEVDFDGSWQAVFGDHDKRHRFRAISLEGIRTSSGDAKRALWHRGRRGDIICRKPATPGTYRLQRGFPWQSSSGR
jgi:hypothetical protein